jgi:hypothetical protein
MLQAALSNTVCLQVRELEAELEPLFAFWKANRKEGEGFGYFVQRVGVAACRSYVDGYVAEGAPSQEVSVLEGLYAKIAERAAAEGKSVAHVTNEMLSKALA